MQNWTERVARLISKLGLSCQIALGLRCSMPIT
uniref:Uncharacterized protein n=1 Tax=Anguilla anguilla TaxID=7936 RepID=A0A0E9TR97_ANGAN